MPEPSFETKLCTSALFGVALLATALVGCTSSNELTRSKVKTLLEADKRLQQIESIRLSAQGFKIAEQQRLWVRQYGRLDMGLLLTPEGSKLFRGAHYDLLNDYCIARLQNPVAGRVSEISGITDIGGISGFKKAEFTWEFRDLPGPVKNYAVQAGRGDAVFQLYDDGWRVQEVNLGF